MKLDYVVQPDKAFGDLLLQRLGEPPSPKKVVITSAFASLLAILRLKPALKRLSSDNCDIRIVLGVDMGGTSKDVLREIATWKVPILIVKNRASGCTFHPKLYLVEWRDRAVITLGSNNITDGGFFTNYEASTLVQYSFPRDRSLYIRHCKTLRRFLNPTGPTAKTLSNTYLRRLLSLRLIPSEEEKKRKSADSQGTRANGQSTDLKIFGEEFVRRPPPLPTDKEISSVLIELAEKKRKSRGRKGHSKHRGITTKTTESNVEFQIQPNAFYMTLPTMPSRKGKNPWRIPGEGRIPLAAVDIASDFWGWPNQFKVRKINPRKRKSGGPKNAGEKRIYHDRPSIWKIWDVANPQDSVSQKVRMYMYENSSDFRFYASPLLQKGARAGDIVCIKKSGKRGIDFECILAKKGTSKHVEWLAHCSQKVRNSQRKFGYE